MVCIVVFEEAFQPRETPANILPPFFQGIEHIQIPAFKTGGILHDAGSALSVIVGNGWDIGDLPGIHNTFVCEKHKKFVKGLTHNGKRT